MAFKLRLARHGAKKRPFYWIMAADARAPRETGKEKLGTYDPCLTQGLRPALVLNEERIRYWLSCGAQPTDRVSRLLAKAGVLPGYTFTESPKRSTPKKKALERQKAAASKA
jgi:small subunit ribosomal protein S16